MDAVWVGQQTKDEMGCAFNLGFAPLCLKLALYCNFRISDRCYGIDGYSEDANAFGTSGKRVLEDFETEFKGKLGEKGELGERLLDFDALRDRIAGVVCHVDMGGCLVYGGEEDQWSWALLCRQS